MRLVRARFEADFSSIDVVIAWVESHIAQSPYKRHCLRESGSGLRGILRAGEDRVALVLCEYMGNIIEHGILRLSKMQLYKQAKGGKKSIGKKNYIECALYIGATHFTLHCRYPFMPKYALGVERGIGGRGKKILTLMGAKTFFVLHRAKVPFVASSLRLDYAPMCLKNKNKLCYNHAF